LQRTSTQSEQNKKSPQNAGIFYCKLHKAPLTVLPAQNTVSPVRKLAGNPPAIVCKMLRSGLEKNYFTALQANFGDPDSSANWYDVVLLAACLLNCSANLLPKCCTAAEV